MRRGSNNRETPKRVPSSKNNRQLVTCRPFRDSCMRTKPNSYRHGSYRLGRVYRQGSKTLFHAYGPRSINWTQKWNTTITPIKTVFILAGHVITPGSSILHMQGTISYRMGICFRRHSRIKTPNRSTNQQFWRCLGAFTAFSCPQTPRRRLLVRGAFKLSCSTPFSHF